MLELFDTIFPEFSLVTIVIAPGMTWFYTIFLPNPSVECVSIPRVGRV